MKQKIDKAVGMLREQGHTVQPQIRGATGTIWFEIDGRMLASWKEMQNLADGIYNLAELEELYVRRRAEEVRRAAKQG
jgi:hypothetical protein